MADRAIGLGVLVGISGLLAASLHLLGAPGVSSPAVAGLLWLGLAGLWGWWRGFSWGIGISILALSVLARMDMQHRQVEVASLETLLAGTLLTGAMVGKWLGISHLDAMRAVFGASLTLAGIAKLRASGPDWVAGEQQARLILERGMLAQEPWQSLRLFLSNTPFLAEAGASIVLGLELLGICLLVPKLRRIYGVLVVGMFVALLVVLGIFQPGWLLSAWVLGAARPESPGPAAPEAHPLPKLSSKNPL